MTTTPSGEDPQHFVESYFPTETARDRASAPKGTYKGRVAFDGSALGGATITVPKLGTTAETDAGGNFSLTLPRGVSEAEALAFAREKQAWIRDHLADRPEEVAIAPGTLIPVEGVARTIAFVPGRRVVLGEDRIGVPEAGAGARLQAFLRELARDRLAAAADGYAARIGRRYDRITLRDTRSRWGSCTSDGGLMFSWRLILAPPEILTYVAAHEVAHLAEMNHSPAFWSLVHDIYGPHDAPRRWLRTQGETLHRYNFSVGA